MSDDAGLLKGPPLAGSSPESRRRERRTALIVLVVLLVVAGAIVGIIAAVRATGDGPQAKAGETLVADSLAADDPRVAHVRLPWGQLDIETRQPLAKVPDSSAYSDKHKTTYDKIAPPPGGRWIPFDIQSDPDVEADATPQLVIASPRAVVPATVVAFVAHGKDYVVTRTKPTAGAKGYSAIIPNEAEGYLALPSRPSDLVVRVSFGGVTQEFHMATGKHSSGAAAPLYRTPHSFAGVNCDKGSVAGYKIVFAVPDACRMTGLTTVPFVAGPGWAKPGRAWLVAHVDPAPPDELSRQGAGYRSHGVGPLPSAPTLTYGDQQPVASSARNAAIAGLGVDPNNASQYVFDVADTDTGRQHAYTLTIRFRLEQNGIHASTKLPVDATATATRHLTVRG